MSVRRTDMRSLLISSLGILCIVGSMAGHVHAQGGATAPTKPANEQKAVKEIKFKIEWITNTSSTQNGKSTETESLTVTAIEGQPTMSANKITGSNTYRRVSVRPDIQPDGSYLVNLSVSEFATDQEREMPRIETMFKVKVGESKVIQDRESKGSNYLYQFQVVVTPSIE